MMRSLWTASTGMDAQQFRIDVIAHNLANVNTAGFKKTRADYQDLLYQDMKSPGSSSSLSTIVPTGIQVGQGVKVVSTSKLFTQGNYQQTQNPLDITIEGKGFFQITLPSGDIGYTRDGAFKVDNAGNMVNSDGYLLEPQITLPSDTIDVTISSDGIVSVTQPSVTTPTQVGNIEVANFINAAGLRSTGKNMYLETEASGAPTTSVPGEFGTGTLAQGFLEMSNVSVVEEMVNMITSQRAYELNSKAIQTSDDMLRTINGLKR
ncbi:Flagellar basal-body rod protein FlgG [hydrothermal vent metagenome]|uniref:Flagellar basal-body rod protein FlgG n=1 Tax=hydrothermal vent metagenome TaxID=652676 RepID=A0A3B0VYV3_9ZZZZ